MRLFRHVSVSALLALPLLAACGTGPGGVRSFGSPDRGEIKGAVGTNARVIGRDDGSLVLGTVVEDKGERLTVQWPSNKATVARSELALVASPTSFEPGQRVIATATAGDRNARVGTIVGAGPRPRIKWDLDDTESEIDGGNVARLIASLCVRTEGCKHGSGEAPSGAVAAALPGVQVGSLVAVSHTIKGAQYWSAAKVLEVQPTGLLVDVPGTGEIKVAAADVRLPATKKDLAVGASALFGKPPGGLAPGYVVRVDGDSVEMSFSPGAESGTKVAIGKEVFLQPLSAGSAPSLGARVGRAAV